MISACTGNCNVASWAELRLMDAVPVGEFATGSTALKARSSEARSSCAAKDAAEISRRSEAASERDGMRSKGFTPRRASCEW